MKWYMDKSYMENHIRDYIIFQLSQGYRLSDIKSALLKSGYDSGLIDEICAHIDPDYYKPRKDGKPSQKNLDEDLYVYLQNLLVDYIKQEQSQGYTMDVIEKALINYGHHPSMVKKALKAASHGDVVDFQYLENFRFSSTLMLFITLFLTLGIVFVLTVQTNEPLFVVVFGFVPALIAILFVYAVFVNSQNRRLVQLLPIISIAVVVTVFVALVQTSATMRGLGEPLTVLLLNTGMGFVMGSMICFFSKSPKRRITVEDIVASTEQQPGPSVREQPEPVAEVQEHKHVHHRKRSKKSRLKIKEFD